MWVTAFRVRGSSPFPTVVLSSECAWPERVADAVVMDNTHEAILRTVQFVQLRKAATRKKDSLPRADRWKECGWVVLKEMETMEFVD